MIRPVHSGRALDTAQGEAGALPLLVVVVIIAGTITFIGGSGGIKILVLHNTPKSRPPLPLCAAGDDVLQIDRFERHGLRVLVLYVAEEIQDSPTGLLPLLLLLFLW